MLETDVGIMMLVVAEDVEVVVMVAVEVAAVRMGVRAMLAEEVMMANDGKSGGDGMKVVVFGEVEVIMCWLW